MSFPLTHAAPQQKRLPEMKPKPVPEHFNPGLINKYRPPVSKPSISTISPHKVGVNL